MFTDMLFKKPFRVFSILFLIYLSNIVVGKISLLDTERTLPLSLSGVVEFLILFCACIFFVAGILQAEQARLNDNSLNSTDQE